MNFRPCGQTEEVRRALASGGWPHGCSEELQEHVRGCQVCDDVVRVSTAFAADRADAMRRASPVPANLLWWRAQLRKRNEAMQRVQRPIVGAQMLALVVGALVAVGCVVGFGGSVAAHSGSAEIFRSFVSAYGTVPLVASGAMLLMMGGVALWLTLQRD